MTFRAMVVVGTRPNFVKAAPLAWEFQRRKVPYEIIHTGQHESWEMAGRFFEGFGIHPTLDMKLGASGPMRLPEAVAALRRVIRGKKPDWVVVVGDVNSTLAAALAAAREGVKIAHVEAGLRSFDNRMVEEHNRRATDSISDLLLASCDEGMMNLQNEKAEGKAVLVGNVMIDTLRWAEAQITTSMRSGDYALATIHRAETTDDRKTLQDVMWGLESVALEIPVLLPLHPRTREKLAHHGIGLPKGVEIVEPLEYLQFVRAMKWAKVVITDSGGIQEETLALDVPCVTTRISTERNVTVSAGTNVVVGTDPGKINDAALGVIREGGKRRSALPWGWDGRASSRIVSALETS